MTGPPVKLGGLPGVVGCTPVGNGTWVGTG